MIDFERELGSGGLEASDRLQGEIRETLSNEDKQVVESSGKNSFYFNQALTDASRFITLENGYGRRETARHVILDSSDLGDAGMVDYGKFQQILEKTLDVNRDVPGVTFTKGVDEDSDFKLSRGDEIVTFASTDRGIYVLFHTIYGDKLPSEGGQATRRIFELIQLKRGWR